MGLTETFAGRSCRVAGFPWQVGLIFRLLPAARMRRVSPISVTALTSVRRPSLDDYDSAAMGRQAKGVMMPAYRFQIRTGNDTLAHGAVLDFKNLAQAIEVAALSLAGQAMREADETMNLAESALEIVDDDGDVVASLPISAAISRH